MPIVVAVDDLIELKIVGNYDGKVETNNVFHYKVTSLGTGTNAPARLNNFGWGWFEAIKASVLGVLADDVHFTSIVCSLLDPDTGNIVNGETVFIADTLGDGAVSGDALPPFVNWTFKYARPDNSFRHGWKRFSGVPEASQVNGIPTSGALTGLAGVAAQLQANLPAYSSPTQSPAETQITGAAAVPVVLQKMKNGDFLSPINVATITSVTFDKIGSQNSRKFGVGV